MTRWCSGETLAEDFEQQRERLVRMAHRMLGSSADAEDAVQEAWLRLARQDASKIDNLAAWLTRVVARICLDALRARKVRPESPFEGRLLPELVATEDDCGGVPEEEMLLAESVGVGLLMVLDTLNPPERLAFVLHDLFAMPFHEVGEILDKSTDATKMLGSRARRKLNRTHPPSDVGECGTTWSTPSGRRRDVVTSTIWCTCSTQTPCSALPGHAAPGLPRSERPT